MARRVADLRLALGHHQRARRPRPALGAGAAARTAPRRADPRGRCPQPRRRRDRPARARRHRPRRRLAGRRGLRGRRRRAAADRRGQRRLVRRDLGRRRPVWPRLEPIAGPDQIKFIQACLAQGVFKPVDQAAQLAAWVADPPARRGVGSVPAGRSGHARAGLLRASVDRRRGHLPRRTRSPRRCGWSCRSTSSDCPPARCPSAATTACRRACNSSAPASGRTSARRRPGGRAPGAGASPPSSRGWRWN